MLWCEKCTTSEVIWFFTGRLLIKAHPASHLTKLSEIRNRLILSLVDGFPKNCTECAVTDSLSEIWVRLMMSLLWWCMKKVNIACVCVISSYKIQNPVNLGRQIMERSWGFEQRVGIHLMCLDFNVLFTEPVKGHNDTECDLMKTETGHLALI